MPKTCCKTSVGVLIFNEARDALLMIERGTLPAGIAPVAGHARDEHLSYRAAARAEVSEEIGLTVTTLTRLPAGGYHPGRCRRAGSDGHTWELYEATVTGDLDPSEREVLQAAWWRLADLQELADRTVDHASGRVSAAQFARWPGLEPVWVHWLSELGYVHLLAGDLNAVEELAATPPAEHASR